MKRHRNYSSNKPERFHGAFTGGFNAGYYNTVGSAEGWTPIDGFVSRGGGDGGGGKNLKTTSRCVEDYMDQEDYELSVRHRSAFSKDNDVNNNSNMLDFILSCSKGEELCQAMMVHDSSYSKQRHRRHQQHHVTTSSNCSSSSSILPPPVTNMYKHYGIGYVPTSTILDSHRLVTSASNEDTAYTTVAYDPEFDQEHDDDDGNGMDHKMQLYTSSTQHTGAAQSIQFHPASSLGDSVVQYRGPDVPFDFPSSRLLGQSFPVELEEKEIQLLIHYLSSTSPGHEEKDIGLALVDKQQQQDAFNKRMEFIKLAMKDRFTPAGSNSTLPSKEKENEKYPRREISRWVPSHLLCKRFGVTQPVSSDTSISTKSQRHHEFAINNELKFERREKASSKDEDSLNEVEDQRPTLDLCKSIFDAESDDNDYESSEEVLEDEGKGSARYEAITTAIPKHFNADENVTDYSSIGLSYIHSTSKTPIIRSDNLFVKPETEDLRMKRIKRDRDKFSDDESSSSDESRRSRHRKRSYSHKDDDRERKSSSRRHKKHGKRKSKKDKKKKKKSRNSSY